MIHLKRVNSENLDFIDLVRLLDNDLGERDGDDHAFYDQFNKIDSLKYVVLAFKNEKAISCGAIKPLDKKHVEIKRMYTIEGARGKGLASKVLGELELWALEMGFEKSRLETGIRQPEAIALYKKNGYSLIPNYGQYQGIENSRCFEKIMKNFS